MKIGPNAMARLMFVSVLLIATIAGAIWHSHSISRYATYQIHTEDPVSGLVIDAPIEFHGVEVGKVKNISLLSPHSVSIVLSIDKNAPVTSATVATITSRGLATQHGDNRLGGLEIRPVGSPLCPTMATSCSMLLRSR